MAKEVTVGFHELVGNLTHTPTAASPAGASTKMESVFADKEYWSLYQNNMPLQPLRFSNGKTQEDIVREVVEHARKGTKVICIHGMCGTGKSAIALNIARKLGRASIVVPVKALQKQYEEDYTKKKHLLKSNGQRMKISMITGRDNHDSLIKPGATCADPSLPELIKITEKNYEQLQEYYEQNPYIQDKSGLMVKDMRRISIAPANPYWSPIVPATYELPLKDAKKKKYKGLKDKEFIFYHRKHGCSYYDQYDAYLDADVIIFNAAKYKIETALNRKPATSVEIIDEADEFLDNFSTQQSLNLTRLATALAPISLEDADAVKLLNELRELIKLEEKNKQALGISEQKIYTLAETKIHRLLELLLKNKHLAEEASLDENSYVNKAYEIARAFEGSFDETYLTYYREDKDICASLVTTNLAKQFQEIVDKNKLIVLMSGTLHSPQVIKEVFGIKDYVFIEAETNFPGTLEIVRTGKEFDCKYSNFQSGKHTRADYLNALSKALEKAVKPTLIHVNAFEDLPKEAERSIVGEHMKSSEEVRELQAQDRDGRLISLFKSRLANELYTTKCARGVDFPGDMCNSIIFTKYPNPNPNDTFWKILQKTHPTYFWDFYKDKARRDFLQRLYRALRSKDDHVYVLSPDARVLDAVQQLQRLQTNEALNTVRT